MGFGYEEARRAGAPYVAPRSGRQMTRDIKEREDDRYFLDAFLFEIRGDREEETFVVHRLREGHSADAVRDELGRLRADAHFRHLGLATRAYP